MSNLNNVANALGVVPSWLDALINFETAGTYSPIIKNLNSSARGLLQFMNSTAIELGYTDSLDLVSKNNTFDLQMENVVLPYLKKYAPFPTKQSLYMAVFYPAYRFKPPETVFPLSVQKANPGIVTIQDYIDKVDRKFTVSKIVPLPLILAMVAVIVYFARKHLTN